MQFRAPASPPSVLHRPPLHPALPKRNDGNCSSSTVPAPAPDRGQRDCDACNAASPPASSQPTKETVILSGAGTSRSEVLAKSKDPYTLSRPQVRQGILPVQPDFLARYSEPSCKLRFLLCPQLKGVCNPPQFPANYSI